MANFFRQQAAGNGPIDERYVMERRYNSARMNLLLAMILTFINIVMTMLGTGTYFLFSIFVPYYVVDMGWFLCGKYPVEYYAEFGEMEFLPDSFLITMVVIAAVVLVLYLLAWVFSKKHMGWMIFALVFFAIDTLAMILIYLDAGIDAGVIVDLVFHIWVFVYLILGVQANAKLKKLPPEEEEPVTPEPAENE